MTFNYCLVQVELCKLCVVREKLWFVRVTFLCFTIHNRKEVCHYTTLQLSLVRCLRDPLTFCPRNILTFYSCSADKKLKGRIFCTVMQLIAQERCNTIAHIINRYCRSGTRRRSRFERWWKQWDHKRVTYGSWSLVTNKPSVSLTQWVTNGLFVGLEHWVTNNLYDSVH